MHITLKLGPMFLPCYSTRHCLLSQPGFAPSHFHEALVVLLSRGSGDKNIKCCRSSPLTPTESHQHHFLCLPGPTWEVSTDAQKGNRLPVSKAKGRCSRLAFPLSFPGTAVTEPWLSIRLILGDLFQIQISRPHPQRVWNCGCEGKAGNLYFIMLPSWSWHKGSLGNHWPRKSGNTNYRKITFDISNPNFWKL